ncbi:MAG TPA: phosphatidate cytidylyltransferase [Clostridia bacterium]|nr:phosphatidate cytidylyltransferase [Clostridia bacterium]
MKIDRLMTGLIGFPIVAAVLIFGNVYLIDATFAIVAMLSIHEYFAAFKNKAKPITWIGYICCILIAFIHLIPKYHILTAIGTIIPLLLLILFLQVIITNMKTTVLDAIITFFGVSYIALFISFIPLLMAGNNGKLLVWYILFAAWGTDTFAYIVGSKFGKHKFSLISPKKSIEGCIGGTIAAIIIILIYTWVLNTYYGMNINYIYISIVGLILSLIGQIGDFAASTIKRFVEIKDFSNLFPGHGGMLDRIDSVIFIAPFAYFLLMIII